MNRLTRLVLKRPVSTLLAVLALFVFGFSSLMGLRLELMPDMEMPMKIVYTVYPGADSESVDDLVTSMIEDKAGSLSGVKSITSRSMENVSMVLLQYDYDQNVNDAYLDLRAALDQVKGDLPDDAQDPMIIEMNMDSMPSISYSVSTTDGYKNALAIDTRCACPPESSDGYLSAWSLISSRRSTSSIFSRRSFLSAILLLNTKSRFLRTLIPGINLSF